MANELDYDDGLPVTLIFALANPGASATTDLALAQGGTGFVVPTGYEFHAMCLCGMSNADLTGGTAIFKVIDNGTEQTNGPTATLSDTVQRASGVQRAQVEPIAAGHVVGVSVTTDGSYAPTTADLDAVLIGILQPAG
jgi:hypothetical protein